MPELTPANIVYAAAATVAVVAYVVFIVTPAWRSYGRLWERIAASLLTLYILAALLLVGAVLGFAAVLYSDEFL